MKKDLTLPTFENSKVLFSRVLYKFLSRIICHFPVLIRRIILMSLKWMMLTSPQFLLEIQTSYLTPDES